MGATLVAALLLMVVAVAISYNVYSRTIYDQYKTMTMNLAKTEAVSVHAEDVAVIRDAVMQIYRNICEENGGVPDFENFDEQQWQEYYARYQSVEELPQYKSTLKLLQKISQANKVNSIYIGYMDVETYYGVYLVDGSLNTDVCPVGTCDPFEESNAREMKKGNYDFPAYITNYEEYGWLCSAGVGIYDQNGEVVGTACIDVSMDDIMKNRQEFLQNLCLVLVSITIVICLLILAGINRILLVPVKSLSQAAALFVKDKESTKKTQTAISQLNIHTGDEIEELSEAIKTMEMEINDYIDHLTEVTAEKERMGAELNIATQIQASMLPCIFPAFPDRNEFDIYASMDPAKEVGGDFYDFFLIDEDHIALVMADVSGKGVPAALFMVIAKTLLKNTAQSGISPKEVLSQVNTQLCENNEAEMFVTVWLGVMQISTGHMVCANAGHEYPAIRRVGGQYELLHDKHGFVLAGMEGSRYREYEITLEKGDSLFVYTDGVPEATNAENELFGTDRMLEALNQNPDAASEEVIREVQKAIEVFMKQAPQFDDITMLSMIYKGKE